MFRGEILRRWRRDRDLSLETLAGQIGCAASYLHDLERGKKAPSLPMLERIIKTTGIPASVLLGENPMPAPTANRHTRKTLSKSQRTPTEV
jgi:transcriptional regulator with XRE-family HTH domain